VTHDELRANDLNLNIRRYADNAPLPEPHDVRAHLVGGVPRCEVDDKADLFEAHGVDLTRLFVDRDTDYYAFADGVRSNADLEALLRADSAVLLREDTVTGAFESWWAANAKFIIELPETKALMAARASLLESFVSALTPVGLLDRFQVAGVIASWWGDIQFDLRALAAGGFGAVIDGWVTTITAALDDKAVKGNPWDHSLVRVLLPQYLNEIAEAESRRTDLDAAIKGAAGNSDEESDDDADEGEPLSPDELKALRKELAKARKRSKDLQQEFIAKLDLARDQLTLEDERALVLGIARSDLAEHLVAYVGKQRRVVIDALENWWDKYAVPLSALEHQSDKIRTTLAEVLEELGYE
jgi:type I restriction enzyme M protein